MYANDMALAADSITELQNGMDVIKQWADENELVMNAVKTELMDSEEEDGSRKMTTSCVMDTY